MLLSVLLYSCLFQLDSQLTAVWGMQAYKAYKLGGKVSELLYSPALYGIDLSAQNMPKPRARSSAMMAVVGNTLWLFGGMVEVRSHAAVYKLSHKLMHSSYMHGAGTACLLGAASRLSSAPCSTEL